MGHHGARFTWLEADEAGYTGCVSQVGQGLQKGLTIGNRYMISQKVLNSVVESCDSVISTEKSERQVKGHCVSSVWWGPVMTEHETERQVIGHCVSRVWWGPVMTEHETERQVKGHCESCLVGSCHE